MNDVPNSHEPSPEFRAQLKSDISRAVRNDHRFGSPESIEPRRLTMIVGIAAAAVLTLVTGMVLGASVSYASAAQPDANAPALAIRPIGNAINALRCAPQETPPKTVARKTVPAAQAAPSTSAETTIVSQAAPAKPDRARVAALARQHQAPVVRGDTAAGWIVMVVDAADRYLWSTHGSGDLSIEVAGDKRTPLEREAYDREHRAEFGLIGPRYESAYWTGLDSSRWGRFDSAYTLDFKRARVGTAGDTSRRGGRVVRRDTGWVSLDFRRMGFDTARYGLIFRDSARYGYFALAGGGRGAVGSAESSRNQPGVYTAGWSRPRNRSATNQAVGLVERKPGESGIEGLASASIAMTDAYHFAPGDLAPKALNILVVHLVAGVSWKPRP